LWSTWLPLSTLDPRRVPRKAGVYQIRWAINGIAQTVSRANGLDASGLLYIGKSADLRRRIRDFRRCVIGKEAPHSAGRTYIRYNFRRKFKPEQLEIRWAVLPKGDHDGKEKELLNEYVRSYLDKPPLNISIRRA
jgi:hypothetical protein